MLEDAKQKSPVVASQDLDSQVHACSFGADPSITAQGGGVALHALNGALQYNPVISVHSVSPHVHAIASFTRAPSSDRQRGTAIFEQRDSSSKQYKPC